MRWPVVLALCAACSAPAFEVHRDALAKQARAGGGRSFLHLNERLVDRSGELTFVRGNRRSPSVLAASVIVGDEGICVPSSYDVARFWRAIRIDEVDRRTETLVLPALDGVTITHVGRRAWEVRGANAALRTWIRLHRYAREKALRTFVDVPAMTYSTRTSIGWRTIERSVLERLAVRAERSVVGWRWSDFERVRYARVWPDSTPSDRELQPAVDDRDREVRQAIAGASGLPPGPCPLRDAGTRMLQ